MKMFYIADVASFAASLLSYIPVKELYTRILRPFLF